MLLQTGKNTFILKKPTLNLVKVLLSSKYYQTTSVRKSAEFGQSSEFDDDVSYRNEYQRKKRNFKNSQMFPPNSKFEHRKYSSFKPGWSNRVMKNKTYSAYETEKIPLPVEKHFYKEHSDVAGRSEDEVQHYRKSMEMSIRGVNVPKPIIKFSELCLPENLMAALNQENYSDPTAIQSQGWPIALSGRDMIGVSQTGSGKTLAYMLPAVVHAANQKQFKDQRECKPQVLVLGPTRELIQQIHRVSKKFIQACGLMGATVYGGASKDAQLHDLQGAEICIATPGRLIDLLAGDQVSLDRCSYLVLDEADRMLDLGFEPQIRDIINQIRNDRQTLMWSATWPYVIRNLAEEFLNHFIHVTIGSGELDANRNIEQKIYVVAEEEKIKKFISLLKDIFQEEKSKVLVFAQRKTTVDYICNCLNDSRIPAMCIHGDYSQSKRDQVLNSFRRDKSSVLIATDVAARGLDITDIQHVVNFDFPETIENYIHRIGRTARGSASGVSHSFFTYENAGLVKELVSVLKKTNQFINPEIFSLKMNKSNSKKLQHNLYRSLYRYV